MHVTIEYVIMIPMLILGTFLFPIFANAVMNTWVNSRQTLALQNVAGQLGSAVQQLYFSLNHDSVPSGTVTYSPGLPPFIESSFYMGEATLSSSASPGSSPSFLQLTVTLVGTSNSVTTTVILGSNVLWKPSIFMSNSTDACVTAQKFSNGTILLWFGG